MQIAIDDMYHAVCVLTPGHIHEYLKFIRGRIFLSD